jgi:hypothetical protein
LKISITKKGLVEWLKVKALNSSPSTGKKLIKKKKKKETETGTVGAEERTVALQRGEKVGELRSGGSKFEASPGEQLSRPRLQNNQSKMNRRGGSSARAPALRAQSH